MPPFNTTSTDPWSDLTDTIVEEMLVPVPLGTCVCSQEVYAVEENFSRTYAQWLREHNAVFAMGGTSTYTPVQHTIRGSETPQWVHKGCVMQCDMCEEMTKRNWTSINNRTVCILCADTWMEANEFDECHECGTLCTTESSHWSNWFDDRLCSRCNDYNRFECQNCGYEATHWDLEDHECEDRDTSFGGALHCYGYKPNPVFHGVGNYYFGIEVEVENRDDSYRKGLELAFQRLDNRGYLKEDGSLNEGFEIVSHPHTLVEMQTNFPWSMFKELQRMGFRSWNTSTCGIHVHVSKTAFDAATDNQRDSHEIRFMKLIYDNEDMSCRIAGRSSSRWATFEDKGRIVTKVKNKTQSSGRYSAINSENEKTHEVRIFRGSLRPERVLSAVEFVAAALEYTRNMKVIPKNKPLGWARFSAYITENSDTYPNLFLILSEIYAKQIQSSTTQEEEND